ncbi:hypothetical protein Aca07nite_72240 [Actinoplanes capillaceus]|uniref:TrbL/VirB6 plasmid conjugal transfer protein n=1 Tax=Actinoplanes campanulatus TaxID=113559 RepID=A0ABQ3WUU3_9ACTN|nr:hypothetical protein [Actinoplanes capillaceus]GID49949.1 hypothetical protein Aca07nite_72240 [Actinoplanes capillaceus]
MTDFLLDGVFAWLAAKTIGLLGSLVDFLASSLFTSPDVTVLPQVASIARKSAVVVDVCFVLAILGVGIASMVGDSVEMRYGLKQLLPRLVVGFVLSAFAVPLTGVLIEAANAVTVSLAGVSAPTTQMVEFVQTRMSAALLDPSTTVLYAVIGLLIVVLVVMLTGSWLTRVCVLLLLAGIAPVALACYATPWTQPAADLWWRSLLGCLAPPGLQAVVFSTGIELVVNPEGNLPVQIGLPASDAGNLAFIAVLLWVTVRIPALVSRYLPSGRSPSVGGILLRAVLLQGIGRRLPLLGGG